MSKSQDEIGEEITLEDIPAAAPKQTKDPLLFLPPELRKHAAKLAPEKAYTVLSLKEEGTGHNDSLIGVAAICYDMGVSFDDTLDHLQAAYSPDRMDYETAPKRAVTRVFQAESPKTENTF